MYDLTQLREIEFPISDNYIYFNHASISPMPARTKRKMQWAIGQLARQPFDFWRNDAAIMIEAFHTEIARYIHAESPQEIAPVVSTSTGLNAVAQAIEWEPGDNLIFCEIEFPSNAYPWMSLARDGVEIRQAPAVDGGLQLEELKRLVDARTRLVSVSAIQFFTGHRADLAAIGEFCHQRGILFVVDAIQAIGHIKLDVQAMHIDVLVTGGQKSLLASPGSGFMYVCHGQAEKMRPRLIGPNATRDYRHWLSYDLTPLPGAARFMAGTINVPGMYGVLESIRLLQELGVDRIDRHTSALVKQAADLLSAQGYVVITSCQAHGPIVTFRTGFDEEKTDALVTYLQEQRTAVVKHLDAAGTPHIRLSFHCYNTEEELARFGRILAGWQ